MSSLLRRPPARFAPHERLEGPFNRVGAGGAIDSAKDADYSRGDGAGIPQPVTITTPYIEQLNPRQEQPKLIFYSGAQPFTNWGWRRFTRTHMTASPRFGGRWAVVGAMIRNYTERGRMTGVPMRLGTTYTYPRFKVSPGPRSIELGNGS